VIEAEIKMANWNDNFSASYGTPHFIGNLKVNN